MFVRIERGSSVPISRQIKEQIRSQILAGRLTAGTQLPSVRELAKQLCVNANTIVRVYEKLASDSLIEMRHGEGTFVLTKSSPSNDKQKQREKLKEELKLLIHQAQMLGLSRGEIRKMMDESFAMTSKESDKEAK